MRKDSSLEKDRDGRHNQWLKKKRSPEETMDGVHNGGRRH